MFKNKQINHLQTNFPVNDLSLILTLAKKHLNSSHQKILFYHLKFFIMPEFLQLCFSWPTLVAFGLITIIALWDIVFGKDDWMFLSYSRHPKVQIACYIFCAAIFILWQLTPEFTLGESNVLVLIVRPICYIVWYIISRLLWYLIFYVFLYYVHWKTLGKLP